MCTLDTFSGVKDCFHRCQTENAVFNQSVVGIKAVDYFKMRLTNAALLTCGWSEVTRCVNLR